MTAESTMTLTKTEQQKRATSVRNKQFGWEIVKCCILLTGESLDGVLKIIEAMGLADDVATRSAVHKKYGKLISVCKNPPDGRSIKKYKLRVHLIQISVEYKTTTSTTLLLFGYEIRTKTIYYEEISLANWNKKTQSLDVIKFKEFLIKCQQKCNVKFEQVLMTQTIIDKYLDEVKKENEILLSKEDWMPEIETLEFGYTLLSFKWLSQTVFEPVATITEPEKALLLSNLEQWITDYNIANTSSQVELKLARNVARKSYAIPKAIITYLIRSPLLEAYPKLKQDLSTLTLKECNAVNELDLDKLKRDIKHGCGENAYEKFCKEFDVAQSLFELEIL
jgi:hypothetical protein